MAAPSSSGRTCISSAGSHCSGLKSGSRPPAPEYCTAAQSPTAVCPSSRTSTTDKLRPASRTRRKPFVTGAPSYTAPSSRAPFLMARWSSKKKPDTPGTNRTCVILTVVVLSICLC